MLSAVEHNLVKQCARGKSSAQKELYDLFSNDMYKICLMYARDNDTANDLLQEGFLKVFKHIHNFKEFGSLGGWIRRIMVNTCIDFYRIDKWGKYFDSIDDDKDYSLIPEVEENHRLNTSDFLSITRDLPDGYRVILNLFFLEDYTHVEIAEKLGITVGTSKSQLFKAKRYLKTILLKTLPQNEIETYGGFDKEVV